MFGRCLEGIKKGSQEGAWKISGELMMGIWKVCGIGNLVSNGRNGFMCLEGV